MKYDVEAIKAGNPLVDKLADYGVEVDRRGYAKCPFHGEKTASFKVYGDDTFHCFGCGAHGDVIDLIRKMEGRSFSEVCEALGGMQSFSGARAAGKRQREVQKRRNRARNLKDDYNKALKVYRRNEEIIECLKPEGPDDKADSIWLAALARRSSLYLKLLAAEEDINKAERGGAANGKLQRVIAE